MTLNPEPTVVTLHRPAAISGVSTAGLRAARLPPPFVAWKPLVVGEGTPEELLAQSPFRDHRGATAVAWRAGASSAEQVGIVRDELRRLRADVVVPNDLAHGYAAAALDHARGRRCLAWIHADYFDGDDLILRCGDLADAWRAVSASGRNRAAGLGVLPGIGGVLPARCEVPDRKPPSRPTGGSGPFTLRLLYAGRLERMNKRTTDLIELAERLSASSTAAACGGRTRFALTIAGEGPARSELESWARVFSREGAAVQVIGPVALDRMNALYADHDITLLLSESEGMPNVVMESLANARPVVITSGCGGALDLVRDRVEGWVVPVGDMERLAGLLARFANGADRSSRLATMSSAAYECARARLSAQAVGPAYDLAVREALVSPWRARKCSEDDAAERWRSILGAIESCGPIDDRAIAPLRADWLASLGMPAETSLPTTGRPVLTSAERLCSRALSSLRMKGCRRVALYGAGRHTAKLTRVLESAPDIVAIVDDQAGNGSLPGRIQGRPVITPHDAADLALDAIIVSSDEYEREMLARAQNWARGVQVLGLYGSVGPPAHRAASAALVA